MKQTLQSCLWIAKLTSLRSQNNKLQTKYEMKSSAYWGISLMDPFLGHYFHSDLNSYVGNTHPEKALRLAGKDGD
jgi:hypothetical protein